MQVLQIQHSVSRWASPCCSLSRPSGQQLPPGRRDKILFLIVLCSLLKTKQNENVEATDKTISSRAGHLAVYSIIISALG
ncbi:hypothetical protein E2C01_090314 [Portunus trituberculatus]|uniref:Uncharacterized protein n=1 Tax=Portunus trituberculatus TaxID=210409 RepID=A0A5B7JPZ1_PORTR|nr:hypothetical protein [Portunus trituberculatus]